MTLYPRSGPLAAVPEGALCRLPDRRERARVLAHLPTLTTVRLVDMPGTPVETLPNGQPATWYEAGHE